MFTEKSPFTSGDDAREQLGPRSVINPNHEGSLRRPVEEVIMKRESPQDREDPKDPVKKFPKTSNDGEVIYKGDGYKLIKTKHGLKRVSL